MVQFYTSRQSLFRDLGASLARAPKRVPTSYFGAGPCSRGFKFYQQLQQWHPCQGPYLFLNKKITCWAIATKNPVMAALDLAIGRLPRGLDHRAMAMEATGSLGRADGAWAEGVEGG